jgi:hypothetical protein
MLLEMTAGSPGSAIADTLGRFEPNEKRVNGRPAWRREDKNKRVLWLSYTGTSWNVQDEADLGKPSGYLFVADTAALPSRAKATWRGTDGKRGWEDLPALRCTPVER